METPTPDPHSGAVLDGRYALGELLHSDASGSAYPAHDFTTGNTVLVIVLHSWLVGEESVVHAFRGRAQHLEAVSHPGLARLLDHGRDGDRVYAVTEYLRGETLDRALSSGDLHYTPHTALGIAASLLEVLDTAHAQGIVHGALTPDRIVVGRDGGVGITGFPLLFDAAEDEAPDTRTDVRAVGLLLHLLLTGERVAPEDVRPLRPSALVDSLPPDLDMLVANATDPNPRYRPRDAGQYLTLVEQVMRSLSRPLEEGGADTTRPIPIAAAELPAPRPRPFRRRLPVLAAAVLLVAALFAVGWALLPEEPEAVLPDLVGVGAEEAEERLESLGLGLEIRFRDTYDDTVEQGGVAGSEPGPGTVLAQGDEVTLALSVGPRRAVVPDVVGDTENEARNLLREAGFTRIDVVQEHSAEQLPGTVLATEPAVGEEGDREEEVVLRVSEGVIVPSLDGMTEEDAVDALTRVGLTAVVVEEHHETVEAGGVSAQNPEPGSILPEEGEVAVTVSTGPEPEEEDEEEDEEDEEPSESSAEETDDDRDEESGNGNGNNGGGNGGGGGGGGGWGDDSCSAPAWRSGTVYEEGERVSHDGREYEARWWNQDSPPEPGSLWGPWSDRGRC
ncbi:PASTA domain-containing protein [Nocardiopsis sp. CC223A]|uniref:PASTA domain-containing protein n=1 Tax=Nocardiopsis sp. CC223A TaxID=3044051 RepID=UPI00279637CF|nr:PASTA domain-containing protein [Nocardiopsis sp. CC223A]